MKSMMNKSLVPTVGLAALVGLVGVGTACAVSFQGIGNLGRLTVDRFDLSPQRHAGYAYAAAAAISADGRTVVGRSWAFSADGTKFLQLLGYKWTREAGIQGLPPLEGLSSSDATDVSGDGTVIVGDSSGSALLQPQHPCIWKASGEIIDLGHLPPRPGTRPVKVSRAYGVSDDGQVVVGESLLSGAKHAFRWSVDTGMVDLGDLPGSNEQSNGLAASLDGSVVVGNGTSVNGIEAFRWEHGTGMVGLGVIPAGRGWSDASGVSADGTVTVGVSSPSSDPWESEAVLWTTSHPGIQRLGDLPGGRVDSDAKAISADGTVVVGSGTTDTAREAVMWDRAGNIYSIQELLKSAGMNLDGWLLSEAVDVSADGTVIVGNGINPDGNREGWIAVLADEEPPVITAAVASSNALWPPNNKMSAITLDAVVTDDSGEAVWGVVGIECNEPGAENDTQIVDDHTVNLRATRSGRGAGRIYTIWLQASDAAGNLSEFFPVKVTVPHDQRSKAR